MHRSSQVATLVVVLVALHHTFAETPCRHRGRPVQEAAACLRGRVLVFWITAMLALAQADWMTCRVA